MKQGLLAIGLTTLDILGRPIDAIPADGAGRLIDEIELVPAGTAGGTALVAARLGLETKLVSALGADRIGDLVRAAFTEEGVDTALVPSLPGARTSATILPIDSAGRRPTFHARGASALVELNDAVAEAALRARFIHWAAIGAPRIGGEKAAAFLATARAKGAVVTCDLISPRRGAMEELTQILPHVDYFMPSEAEVRILTGLEDDLAAARRFRDLGAGTCIVKRGARGWLMVDEAGVTEGSAHRIEVVDTTSCGDAFCAGFIAALDRGWPPDQACRFGSAVAAVVAQELGTLGRLDSFAQAEQAMMTLPLR